MASTESVVEEAALARLEGAGWQIAHGPTRSGSSRKQPYE